MLPVIVPLTAFRLFTATVVRDRIPFSPRRMFSEFSSLVELLTLADEIYYFNVGAFNFEWTSGNIIPGQNMPYNPFAPFHSLPFVKETPFQPTAQAKDIVRLIPEEEWNKIASKHFANEPKHDFSLWTYLNVYVQAYNGKFGRVSTKEYPLVRDLIPEVVSFSGSARPVTEDPLVFKAYDLLKAKYTEKLKGIELQNLASMIIPPITATLLSRLPDNCTNPSLVIKEILELREELTSVRKHYGTFEAKLYDTDSSLKDLEHVEKAIHSDADAFEKRYGLPFSDNVLVRWFVDNVSFLAKLLIKQNVDEEEVITLVAKHIPNLGDRIGVVSPSRLFNMAMKTRNIKGYQTLTHTKLGLTL